MIPDAELVWRSLSHGSHHFGVLIQRHSNYLFALAMRMTKGQHALAEDVVQQSFLNAFSRLKSFDRKRDFLGWLTGISVNCYRDMLRKSPPYEELEVAAPDTVESADEVLKLALTKELKPIQWTEVDKLSESKKDDKSQASIQ